MYIGNNKTEEVQKMNFGGRGALSRAVLKPAACAALALTMLSQPASAATVKVDGLFYEIAFFGLGRSFDDDEADLVTTPWWTDAALAETLASEYLAQIGVDGSPFNDESEQFNEIRFAFEANEDPATVSYAYLREADFPIEGIDPFTSTSTDDQSSGTNETGDKATYAYAVSITAVPLPPAGLALGAALLGLMGLRRLKAAGASRTA